MRAMREYALTTAPKQAIHLPKYAAVLTVVQVNGQPRLVVDQVNGPGTVVLHIRRFLADEPVDLSHGRGMFLAVTVETYEAPASVGAMNERAVYWWLEEG